MRPCWEHLGRLLAFLGILTLADLPLAGWQAYAWLAMIQDRAPSMGLQDALADTFSGESPCTHCLAIRKAKKQKKETPPLPENRDPAKPAATSPARLAAALFPPQRAHWPPPASSPAPPARPAKVPLPPPQGV